MTVDCSDVSAYPPSPATRTSASFLFVFSLVNQQHRPEASNMNGDVSSAVSLGTKHYWRRLQQATQSASLPKRTRPARNTLPRRNFMFVFWSMNFMFFRSRHERKPDFCIRQRLCTYLDRFRLASHPRCPLHPLSSVSPSISSSHIYPSLTCRTMPWLNVRR